jgi:hypothetical protein
VKNARQIVLTKSDGTLERFSAAKLTNCLANVLRAQAYDPRLAGPLTNAVAMHLQEWQDPAPPTSAYIYRCVRAVLQQTGLSDVADVLAEHRRQRQARRRRLRVVDSEFARGPGHTWHKGRLVRTLQGRYGLRHGVSRFVAGRIEAQIFGLDYRTVSRPFLAELVRNELLAWGLADELPAGAGAPGRPPVETGPPNEEG